MSDLFRLDGKVVVVIGAGSGIGQAVAVGAARQGARVECLDISVEAAQATALQIRTTGMQADSGGLDIVDGAATNSTLQQIVEDRGRIDGLVCTPGINVRKKLLDYTEEEFDRVVRLNLKGSFNVVRTAGRLMMKQGAGSLVLFSSIRSLAVEPGQA